MTLVYRIEGSDVNIMRGAPVILLSHALLPSVREVSHDHRTIAESELRFTLIARIAALALGMEFEPGPRNTPSRCHGFR